MRLSHHHFSLAAKTVSAGLIFAHTVFAGIQPVLTTENNSPDGIGKFDAFKAPSINNLGQVAFEASLSGVGVMEGVNDEGIYRAAIGGTTVQIVRRGEEAPDGGVYFLAPSSSFGFHELGSPLINDDGQVAFATSRTVDPNNFGGTCLGSGPGTLIEIIRYAGQVPGQPAGTTWTTIGQRISLNNEGQVGFYGTFPGQSGFFIGDGTSAVRLSQIGASGPCSASAGNFTVAPAINDLGVATFAAGTSANGGILTSDGTSCGVVAGMPPSMTPLINELSNVAGCTSTAAYLDGTVVAQTGQVAPGGGGTMGDRFGFLGCALNDELQMTFLTGIDSGAPGDAMIVRRNPDGSLTKIARVGELTPDGVWRFGEFVNNGPGLDHPKEQYGALNEAGQVAFSAELYKEGDPATPQALFLYDDIQGLQEIVREGDSFLGHSIEDLGFSVGGSADLSGVFRNLQAEQSAGFNDRGQIAFSFKLDDLDETEGIAISDPLLGDLPTATAIQITTIEKAGSSALLEWVTVPAGAPVDVYRSEDLASWGSPLSIVNLGGSYSDPAPPSMRAFYVVVPSGVTYPSPP